MKIFLSVLVLLGLNFQASAQWARTPPPSNNHYYYPPAPYPQQPYPYYGYCPSYPNPGYYPSPMPMGYITCFAQGLANGAYFYGIGMNAFVANQWAQYACQSTGQYCQSLGCRY
jgi:hypothetical protein